MNPTTYPRPTPAAAPRPDAGAYLRATVMTATPEQLQLMLYDGAIRFAEQGKAALAQRRFDRSYDRLTRAQKVVSELQAGLRPDRDADLCRRLDALYDFAYRRLVEANVGHDPRHVDEALDVLRYQRETWSMLMRQAADEKAASGAASLPMPSPEAERVERLSVAV